MSLSLVGGASIDQRLQSLSLFGGDSIQKRNTAVQPPCFVNDADEPATIEILDYYLQRIITPIHILKLQSESLLQRMNTTYCINLSNAEKESAGFIDLSTLDANSDSQIFLQNFCSDATSFITTMRTHYDMLNDLAFYVVELRRTANDDTSAGLLTQFLEDIYDTMCKIKSALRSVNQNPVVTVPYGELSDVFKQYRDGTITRCIQQTSEYVTMLDSKRIAEYLQVVYSSFETTVSKCQ